MIHYPFRGEFRCTSPFGDFRASANYRRYLRNRHEGIDLVSDTDKTVVAIMSGTVLRVRMGGDAYGNSVYISHNDGKTSSLYGHLDSVFVSDGEQVKAGQGIGIMGNTGNSSGPHLHLSVYSVNGLSQWYKNLLDPADFLNLPYSMREGRGTASGGAVRYASVDELYPYEVSPVSRQIYAVTGEAINTGIELFGRRYKILVSDEDGNSIDVSGLECSFEIIKTAYLQMNVSKVSIYNLSSETESAVIMTGAKIIVQAGYENGGHYGTIFKGRIYQKIKQKENGTTYILHLLCLDSSRFYNYAVNAFTISENQTLMDALLGSVRNTVFEGTGIEVGSVSLADIVYPRGKVVYGPARVTVQDMARVNNSSVFMDDETLNTLNLDEVPQESEVVYINARSGMVGSPVEIPIQTGGRGIKVQCLLNPLIRLQNLIHVDNASIVQNEYDFESGEMGRKYFLDKSGLYRVVKITYKGDTRGQEWYSEIEAVSQAGGIAGLLQSSTEAGL